ncbi:MAG: replicative DNA helicase [Deltaproteobacteria bacterium]|nr:replicative DNA helicase [Deltaproteobacteria bacterium]
MPQTITKVPANILKVPPHNTNAEKTILGGILMNTDAMSQVIDIISPEDFYSDAHSFIFEGMRILYDRGEPIDIITLSNVLSSKKVLEKAGGQEYLVSLVEAVSTSAGIAYHAKIVRELSVRRMLISKCSAIAESCFHEWESTEDLLEMAEQSIFEIAENQVNESLDSLKDVVTGSFKKLEGMAAIDGFVTGTPSGFKDFDKLTAGLQPSDLIIIAGRPSMGKTAFALNIAYNAAKATKKAVVVFSLEMSKLQLGIRLLGFDAGIDAAKLRAGFLRNKEWVKLTEAASRLAELPIFIDDTSSLSVLEMKAKCRRLKKKFDLGLVVIDYLQLIHGKKHYESRQIEISEISRTLKALAKDLNTPVMALSQLNRKVEDRPGRKPQLSDLRESGAIEQDADVIAFISRNEMYNPDSEEDRNIAEITVAKQRNGPTGKFRLTFQKEFTRFRNYVETNKLAV